MMHPVEIWYQELNGRDNLVAEVNAGVPAHVIAERESRSADPEQRDELRDAIECHVRHLRADPAWALQWARAEVEAR